MRIGISVVAEKLQGTPFWQSALDDLLELTKSSDEALHVLDWVRTPGS